jgi:hypothetical protein
MRIGKQYLVKWERCQSKVSQWMKLIHLDHLPEMVEKFEKNYGHEMGNRKTHNEKSNTSS